VLTGPKGNLAASRQLWVVYPLRDSAKGGLFCPPSATVCPFVIPTECERSLIQRRTRSCLSSGRLLRRALLLWCLSQPTHTRGAPFASAVFLRARHSKSLNRQSVGPSPDNDVHQLVELDKPLTITPTCGLRGSLGGALLRATGSDHIPFENRGDGRYPVPAQGSWSDMPDT
jgi:hypothetical protein